jgi:hypothetical protein
MIAMPMSASLNHRRGSDFRRFDATGAPRFGRAAGLRALGEMFC